MQEPEKTQEPIQQSDKESGASAICNVLSLATFGAASLLGGASLDHDPAYEMEQESMPPISVLQAEVSTGQALSNVFGSTFESGSAARQLHADIENLRRAGRSIPNQKVADMFDAAGSEAGTRLTPQFVRHYASRYKDSATASASILGFLESVPYLKASETFLNQFWQHEDPSVLKLALILSADNIKKEDRTNLFERLSEHEHYEVRSACIATMISKCEEPEGFRAADYVYASTMLPTSAHTAGNEIRIAMALKKCLQNSEHNTLDEEELEAIKVPLLHTLQRIEHRFPELMHSIDSAGEGRFDLFCCAIANDIVERREKLGADVLFDKDTKVYIALHYEEDFTPFPLKTYLSDLGVEHISCMKAGKPAHGDPGERNPGGGAYPDSDERTKFLEDLKALETATPKADYLETVRAFAGERDEQAVLWNLMHGGPDHFWFYSGNPGTEVAEDLAHPFAISHEELAKTLFMTQYEQLLEEGTEHKSISLGHLTFVLDSCRQYTVAEHCQQQLVQLAIEHEVALESMPRFVSLNQRMMYGELNVVAYVSSDERGNRKEIASSVKSPFNIGLEQENPEDGKLLIKHLYPVDRGIANKIEGDMKDPDRMAPLRPWNKRDDRDEDGLRGFHSQDPAIFDASGWDLDHVIHEAIKEVNQTYLEEQLSEELLPKSGTEAHRRLFEISQRDQRFSEQFA